MGWVHIGSSQGRHSGKDTPSPFSVSANDVECGSDLEKASSKAELTDMQQSNWPGLFNRVKVMSTKMGELLLTEGI